jgi:beta-lactamase class A
MRSGIASAVLIATIAAPFAHAAPPPKGLEKKLRALVAASGAEVAIAFKTLDGRSQLLIDPDRPFHAASTMKVPVMIELFKQARAGSLSLEDQLPIRNEFRSIVDNSPYKLSEGADSDKDIYSMVGKTLALRQLCEAMITVSSNFAANLLIERVGVDNIRATVKSLGADGMQVLRGVEDQKAFDKNLNNSTTARGLLVLFERLGHGTAVSPEADGEMIDVLKRQTFNEGIPSGLPKGIVVAHKTGNITRVHHDAGIVFAKRPYVLVILVRGVQDIKKSAALMASIAKTVHASAGE